MNTEKKINRIFLQMVKGLLILSVFLWTVGCGAAQRPFEVGPAGQVQQMREPVVTNNANGQAGAQTDAQADAQTGQPQETSSAAAANKLTCKIYETTFSPSYLTDEKDVKVSGWQTLQDANKRVYFFYSVLGQDSADSQGNQYDLYYRYTDDGKRWSQKSLVAAAFPASAEQLDSWESFKAVLAPDGNPRVYLLEKYASLSGSSEGWQSALRTVSFAHGVFQLSPDRTSFKDKNGVPIFIFSLDDVKYDQNGKPMFFYMYFDKEGRSLLYMNDMPLSEDGLGNPPPSLIENLPSITPWYFDSKGNVHTFLIDTTDSKSQISHSFSTDSGKTWSKPAMILEDLSNPAIEDASFNAAGNLTVVVSNLYNPSNPYALFKGTIKYNEPTVKDWEKYFDRVALAESFQNGVPDANGLCYVPFDKIGDWGGMGSRIVGGQPDFHVDIIMHNNGEYAVNKINHPNMTVKDSYILSNQMLFLFGTDANNNFAYGIVP
jgi:hypothetical protein